MRTPSRPGLPLSRCWRNETFPQADPNSKARYEAMIERTREKLGFGNTAQKPAEIITELGTAKISMAQAKERHAATKNQLGSLADQHRERLDRRGGVADPAPCRTTLQASYQVTSILSKLQLTNYL